MTKPIYREGFVSKQSPDGELSFEPVTYIKFHHGYSFARARDVSYWRHIDDNWLMPSPLQSLLRDKAYEVDERGTFKFQPTHLRLRRDVFNDLVVPFVVDSHKQTADVLFRAKCNIGSLRVII